MPFHTKLKELRLKNRLSQEQLSIKLDIARRPYIEYEKGEKFPPVEVIIKMARFFNVSISFLLDEQTEPTAKMGQLANEISILFASMDLSETDKDAAMEAIQEAYKNVKGE